MLGAKCQLRLKDVLIAKETEGTIKNYSDFYYHFPGTGALCSWPRPAFLSFKGHMRNAIANKLKLNESQ